MKFKTLFVLLLTPLAFSVVDSQLAPGSAHSVSGAVEPQQTDADSALSRGRALLKQGHADQALGYLENALKLFTQSNSRPGVAAAEDGLGDLYLIQGQYKVALDHYRSAYEAFVAASRKDETNQAAATETVGSAAANGFNANLMLAKIGDTNYRLGRMSEAST
ncbi:MAG TPA: tetratricopeptide repeat protein, partial [Pyrinomonadaceae bacterium]|nr:tetratricopeptide repeat protein [Pyrinomonadaceae bacterium]